jgi:hypothetical protein
MFRILRDPSSGRTELCLTEITRSDLHEILLNIYSLQLDSRFLSLTQQRLLYKLLITLSNLKGNDPSYTSLYFADIN